MKHLLPIMFLVSTSIASEFGASIGTILSEQSHPSIATTIYKNYEHLRVSALVSQSRTKAIELSPGSFRSLGVELSTINYPTTHTYINSGIGLYSFRNTISKQTNINMSRLGYIPEEHFKTSPGLFFEVGISTRLTEDMRLTFGGKYTSIHTSYSYNLVPISPRLRGDIWSSIGIITSNRPINLSNGSLILSLQHTLN